MKTNVIRNPDSRRTFGAGGRRSPGRIRILHADDHMLVRMGVSALLTTVKDMEIVGEARNGRQAVELADSLKPDVVIMDLMLPEMLGGEAVRRIHESHPEIKVLVLTTYGTALDIARAVTDGAAGVMFMENVDANLIWTIRSVAAGHKAIPSRLLSQIEEDSALLEITDRQLDILASVADGQSNSDIAKQFGVSEITIKKHLSAAFRCLGVANRSEAVALAMKKHILRGERSSSGGLYAYDRYNSHGQTQRDVIDERSKDRSYWIRLHGNDTLERKGV